MKKNRVVHRISTWSVGLLCLVTMSGCNKATIETASTKDDMVSIASEVSEATPAVTDKTNNVTSETTTSESTTKESEFKDYIGETVPVNSRRIPLDDFRNILYRLPYGYSYNMGFDNPLLLKVVGEYYNNNDITMEEIAYLQCEKIDETDEITSYQLSLEYINTDLEVKSIFVCKFKNLHILCLTMPPSSAPTVLAQCFSV